MPHPSFATVAAAILERAGGTYSLEQAANMLGATAEELHSRIQDGEVLGVALDDGVTLIPRLQFADGRVLTGIRMVIRTFQEAKAGPWMVLQFLADQDPNLAKKPTDALQSGNLAGVEHAARAHLSLDEC